MAYGEKYIVYLSSQTHQEIDRICGLNFENLYHSNRQWKGHFNACVQWVRLLYHCLFAGTDWNVGKERKDIFKANLLDGELGSCHYKLSFDGSVTIIYVIDIKFNKFQFQGFELLLDEPNYRVGYKPKFKIKGGKNAMKGKRVIKRLKSGYYLLKAGGHMTFLTKDKEDMLFPNKWFVAATDFYNGKAYVQCSDNNIYEIDEKGNMGTSEKSLGDIQPLLEAKSNRRMTFYSMPRVSLFSIMRMLTERKKGLDARKEKEKSKCYKVEKDGDEWPMYAYEVKPMRTVGNWTVHKGADYPSLWKGLERYGDISNILSYIPVKGSDAKKYLVFSVDEFLNEPMNKMIVCIERKGRSYLTPMKKNDVPLDIIRDVISYTQESFRGIKPMSFSFFAFIFIVTMFAYGV